MDEEHNKPLLTIPCKGGCGSTLTTWDEREFKCLSCMTLEEKKDILNQAYKQMA